MDLKDQVVLKVKAGNGGDGSAHFRKEKFVPRGGPDGGDGGNGASVIIKPTVHRQTLAHLTGKKEIRAVNGENGSLQKMHGASGEDIIIEVPFGTEVVNVDTGKVVIDIDGETDGYVLLRGGNGGWGNCHFKSSTNQAPERANPGQKGESMTVQLTLKLIADIGLVGLPNAGKSSLLNALTNAGSKTANYPFTTIKPHLGVLKTREREVVIADIPGLIEGASKGRGLGHEFLKHIERTKVLVHMIAADNEDVCEAYKAITVELGDYSQKLLKKPILIVLNKIDLVSEEVKQKQLNELQKCTKSKIVAISALTNQNIDQITQEMLSLLTTQAN